MNTSFWWRNNGRMTKWDRNLRRKDTCVQSSNRQMNEIHAERQNQYSVKKIGPYNEVIFSWYL